MNVTLPPDLSVSTDYVTIYALRDPRTMDLRYVGKANDPARRLRQHLEPGQLDRYRSVKNSWLKSLKELGLKPLLEIVDEVPEAKANEAERYWIQWYLSQGAPLTNGTAGGEGGAITDPVARARVIAVHQGAKRTDEVKKKMSLAAKARCANEQERERLRSISNGRPPVRPGEASNLAKLTEGQVREIRHLYGKGVHPVLIAAQFSVTPQNVWNIVKRRTWKHVLDL